MALLIMPINHSDTSLDAEWYGAVGCSLVPSRSQMWRISRIDNSRTLFVMISWVLYPDLFSSAVLNALSASTAPV